MRLQPTSPVLLSLVCLLGCGGSGQSAAITDPTTPVTLTRFRTDSIAFAQYSGITAAGDLVVRDAAAWSALWQRIHAGQLPIPSLPEVDFSREVIVSAAMGTQSSGGYNILLTGASEDARGVEIRVLESSPGAGCGTTTALTQPVDLARMARQDVPIRFVASRQVRECSP